MGFSIAEAAANAGANVTLVAGPTNQQLANSSIKLVNVVNAKEMYDACFDHFKSTDIAILVQQYLITLQKLFLLPK